MIGTIRKHSAWLWWVIAGLTIISFVWFMGSGPARRAGNGNAGSGNYGTIYGHEISADEMQQAQRDFYLYFLVTYGEWPDHDRNVTELQITQQTYLNLMLAAKAKSMNISVPDDLVADAALQMLNSPGLERALGTSGQPVPMDKFVENVLKPKGFTDADFQHSVRTQMINEQLRMTLGLAGALVTPQEASALYDTDHREVSAQAVFFSASNYLSQVTVTPQAVGQFYTNNMAYYRVPDRLQVNYVWFNLTNYFPAAKTALTNLDDLVESNYKKYGTSEEFKDYKTPDEIKSRIRDLILQQRAAVFARNDARDFIATLFAMDPVKLENFNAAAAQKNLHAKLSEPFSANDLPAEFANAPAVVRTAQTLNADSPFSDAIAGEDGIYVIGLANQLPSSIPSFAEINPRVVEDFRQQSALALAQKAGTNFYFQATVQAAAGNSFGKIAIAQGLVPMVLSPFSWSSTSVPEVGDRAQIGELKQAAFSTPAGGISRFMPTADGGFVLHVQSFSPPDPAKKTAELPQFSQQIRRGRENEAFNIWVNNEASRQLNNIPALQKSQSQP